MSTQVLVSSGETPPPAIASEAAHRRSANFHPSIWGDFLNNLTVDQKEEPNMDATKSQIENLKSKTKNKLLEAADEPSQQLKMIDSIQRLGLAYHFDEEIEEILTHIFHIQDTNNAYDLNLVSLHFRLLRQHGHKVSCDVFNKFKDDQRDFKEELTRDVQGMLSLYQAVQLRVHGETILDEAHDFAWAHLSSMAAHLSPPLSTRIIQTLKQPVHRDIPRLSARKYISEYEEDELHDPTLLMFAKLDFNAVQKIHQQELRLISKWWKDLDCATNFPFTRDRIVELYFWAVGVYFEPEYHRDRKILCKVIALTSILDDIYDVYGTPEELPLLAEAINRWDTSMNTQLPEYMRKYFEALCDVFMEIEKEMIKQGSLYRLYYAKEAMKMQAKSYYEESKWLSEKYVPSMEEYMSLALVTSGHYMLSTISIVGMGDIVTMETFEWISNKPKMAKASSVVCRLMDDIVSHEFEQKRGHVASAVECYMKQYGASEEEACEEFRKQITDAWKDMNEECLKPTPAPPTVFLRILNLSRFIDVVYKEKDGFTHSESILKDIVQFVLIDPAPIDDSLEHYKMVLTLI